MASSASSASSAPLMPEGWVFGAIWKHHAEARAKVCIPDTVLVKDGAPFRWLFTSRAGEVVRKRALDLVAVRDRFAKIALVHRNNEQVSCLFSLVSLSRLSRLSFSLSLSLSLFFFFFS